MGQTKLNLHTPSDPTLLWTTLRAGPGHPIQVVVAASHNRSLLLLSTLLNVLMVRAVYEFTTARIRSRLEA